MKQSDCVELDERQLDVVRRAVPGGARNVQQINRLTPAQEGMLFHYRIQNEGGLHVLSILVELPLLERAEATITAVQRAVDRYDSLRSAVLWEQLSFPVQVVHCEATVPVDRLILTPGINSIKQLQELIPMQRRKLDLQRAPLLRVLIAVDEGQNKWYAALVVHHLVCDHISWRILLSEVAAQLGGCPANELVHQEGCDAATETRHLTDAQEAQAYFKRVMSDVDESTAPFGLLEIREDGAGMVEARGMIESDLAKRLRAQARRFRVSPARLFHAAWGLVVAHTSGRSDVVFGTVLNVRSKSPRTQFGMFVNTLPLCLHLGGITAIGIVDHARCQLAELLRFKDASLPLAQRCSSMPGPAPLFTSLLNYRHSESGSSSELFGQAGVRVLIEEEALTNYPLSIAVDDLGDDFSLIAQTDHRIDPHRITEYLCTATKSLVHALEHDSRTPALQLAVVSQCEKHLLVRRLNETLQLYRKDKMIHELFEEQVELTPNESAVEYRGQALTYVELNNKANKLAWSLKEDGVGPERVVGLCVERGFDMVVGVLAILKAGGAFLPLDPKQPVARLQCMLAEVAPLILLLTQTGLTPRLPEQGYRTIFLDREWDSVESQCASNPSAKTTGLCVQNLAYVIYTSGSTGIPKGVMVEHGSVLNLVQWGYEVLKPFRPRRCSALANITFDASVLEIWPSLCFGATLVLSPAEIANDPALLLEWWDRQRVDVSFLPTPIAELAFSREIKPAGLQLLLVGGDRLHCHPPENGFFRVQDNFGPTETTVVATSAVIGGRDTVLHIGKPISNTQVYVLGPGLQPAPIEVPGEIYIGGAGVSRGYFNKPASTAERFVPDLFSGRAASRLYRTGDLGRWKADGTLEFLGRTDRQLKIRGYRVEPGEIECQLMTCRGVGEAVVVGRSDEPGDDRLVAYFTAEAIVPSKEYLQSFLKERLPAYMVPAAYVQLESFPLAPSGKIDRRQLPSPRDDDFCRDIHEAPSGRKEVILASLWRELLQVDRVGRRDNFLALGGHSLLAMRLLERMRQEGLSTSVQVILLRSSLMELAEETEEIGEILL